MRLLLFRIDASGFFECQIFLVRTRMIAQKRIVRPLYPTLARKHKTGLRLQGVGVVIAEKRMTNAMNWQMRFMVCRKGC